MSVFYRTAFVPPQSPVQPGIDTNEWPCKLCGQTLRKNPHTLYWESEETLNICDGQTSGRTFLHVPGLNYEERLQVAQKQR